MTVHEALNSAIALLRQRDDIAEWAARDANILLQHLLAITRMQILAHPERILTSAQQHAYSKLIRRRLQATPIQYLTGRQEFYGREFAVTPDVLIPRPETELIVDLVKQRFDANVAIKIADVGTGSGILAVTLALEFPNADVTALDISPAAIEVATENAQRLGAGRVGFLLSDLLEEIGDAQFDLIVSNPPYIAEGDRDEMHAQVTAYEPALALFAGDDGNDVYRRLIPQAWSHLRAGGWLVMEQGTQGDVLLPLLQEWRDIAFYADLQGIPRVVTARR